MVCWGWRSPADVSVAVALVPPRSTPPPRRWLAVQVDEGALQALTFVSHRYSIWYHNFLALLFGEVFLHCN